MPHTRLWLAAVLASAVGSKALAQVNYVYDDGTGNVNTGFNQVADFLWGNVYQTQPGGEVITRISVAFGTIPDGSPVRVMLFDIANGSLNPLTGVKKVSVAGTSNFMRTNAFVHFDIPPTRVSGSFFVGCAAGVDATSIRPARIDASAGSVSLADRAWVFAATSFNTITTLSAAPFSLRLDNNAVGTRGPLMVRAVGRPPNCLVDFNDDGVVSPDDLDGYITAFLTEPPLPGPTGLGAAPCPGQPSPYDELGYAADANRDCVFDQEDLMLFITAYMTELSSPTECNVAPG